MFLVAANDILPKINQQANLNVTTFYSTTDQPLAVSVFENRTTNITNHSTSTLPYLHELTSNSLKHNETNITFNDTNFIDNIENITTPILTDKPKPTATSTLHDNYTTIPDSLNLTTVVSNKVTTQKFSLNNSLTDITKSNATFSQSTTGMTPSSMSISNTTKRTTKKKIKGTSMAITTMRLNTVTERVRMQSTLGKSKDIFTTTKFLPEITIKVTVENLSTQSSIATTATTNTEIVVTNSSSFNMEPITLPKVVTNNSTPLSEIDTQSGKFTNHSKTSSTETIFATTAFTTKATTTLATLVNTKQDKVDSIVSRETALTSTDASQLGFNDTYNTDNNQQVATILPKPNNTPETNCNNGSSTFSPQNNESNLPKFHDIIVNKNIYIFKTMC